MNIWLLIKRLNVVFVLFLLVGALFLMCSRDNPFDSKGSSYIPGMRPHVHFETRSDSTFIHDSSLFIVTWSDTASGGWAGSIVRFEASFDGDTNFEQHLPGSSISPCTLTHVFTRDFAGVDTFSTMVYIRALDSDSLLSDIDSMSMAVVTGRPVITNFYPVPEEVYINDTLSFLVDWSDTAGARGRGLIARYQVSFDGDTVFESAILGNQVTPFLFKHVFTAGMVNNVYVRAVDNDSQYSEIKGLSMTVRSGRPVIVSATAPSEVAIDGKVTVSVSAFDTNGTIKGYAWKVNNGPETASDSSSRTFTFSVSGTDSIWCRVFDDDGLYSVSVLKVVSVIPDTVKPSITMINPSNDPAIVTTSQLPIILTTDASGIASVWINGIDAKPDGQNWSSTVTLSSGLNNIIIIIMDNHGNRTIKTLHVTYTETAQDNTPPVIQFFTPDKDSETVATQIMTVIFAISDNSPISAVYIKDTLVNTTVPGKYSCSASLKDGLNLFAVRASDNVGNTAYDTLHIFYVPVFVDSIPPSLSISEPLNHKHIPEDSVQVAGTVYDASGIKSVLVNGVTTLFSNTNWQTKIKLTHGSNEIIVMATDNSIRFNPTAKSVSVIQNNPPVFTDSASSLPNKVIVGQSYSVTIHASDKDQDPMSYKLLTSNGATVTSNNTSAVLAGYTPSVAGADSFSVEVRDTFNDCDTLTWLVTVFPIGAVKPSFTTDTAKLADSVFVDQPYTAQLTATDPQDLPLTYSLITPSPAAMTVDTSGLVRWTPTDADSGQSIIVAVVSNGTYTDTLQWFVWVILKDRAPALQVPAALTIKEDSALTFLIVGNDPDHDHVRFAFLGSFPAGAGLDSNRFSWRPTYRDAGIYTIRFTATEIGKTPALADTDSVIVTVTNVATPPALTNPGTQTVDENKTLSFVLSATDLEGDAITYGMVNGPLGATLQGNSFNWVPGYTQAGSYVVKFFARDNGLPPLADTQQIIITVINVNRAPVITTDSASILKFVYVNELYRDTVATTDPDLTTSFTYAKISGPAGLAIDGPTGIVTFTPATSDTGIKTATIQVCDNDAVKPMYDTLTWRLTVACAWPRYVGSTQSNDTMFCVRQTLDGGYVACGRWGLNAVVVRTNFRGDTLWSTILDVSKYAPVSASATGIIQNSDGTFTICGIGYKANESGAYVWQIAANGANLAGNAWGFFTYDVATSIIPGNNGEFIVCGATRTNNGYRPAIYKFSSNISTTPLSTYFIINNARVDYFATSVAQINKDTLIMCGLRDSANASNGRVFLIKTRYSDLTTTGFGAQIISSVNNWNEANSVIPVSGGGFIVSGATGPSKTTNQASIMKLSATPAVLWSKQFGPTSGRNVIYSAVGLKDGGYAATGQMINGTSNSDLFLLKVDAGGTQSLLKFFGGTSTDGGRFIQETSDGSFIMAGFAQKQGMTGGPQTDMYLIKTDALGNQQ